MLGSHVRRKGQWWMAPLGLPSFKREERAISEEALDLLERLDIAHYAKERSSSLPYGAQRRLEIARALATRPRLLLLDEPAAGMNPQESTDLMNFIARVRGEFGLSILLIEHDMKVVMGVCEHIWVLEYGRLIADGAPEDIRRNPDVLRAYLGKEGA
jgi:branched-chain amino acid transport system ATP-binding protein